MTEHRVVVDGVALTADVHGPNDAPSVVVLHGFSGGAAAVAELTAPLLLLGRRVVVPDLVGHGRSDAPVEVDRYSMAACVAQLEGLCRSLDVGPTTLVGYSMGGRVALSWMLACAHRAEAVIAIGASPGLAGADDRSTRRRADDELADRIERDGMAWFARFWAGRPLFATQGERLSSEQRQRLHQLRESQRPHGLANSLRGMGTGAMPYLPPEQLAECTVRSLLVAGADDPKFCQIGGALARSLPDGEFVSIAGAGHAAHLEQPRRVGRVVARFMEGR